MRCHNAVPGSASTGSPAPDAGRMSKAFKSGLVAACVVLLALPGQAQAPVSPPVIPPLAAAPPIAEKPRPLATPIPLPNLPLGVVTFPNGKAINLNVGIGSSAFRHVSDVPGRIWLLTDRGPNIDCADARRIIGLEADQLCGNEKTGRLHPLPGFVPSIYGVDIGADMVGRIGVFLPIKGKSGKPVSGRPPVTNGPMGEAIFAADGKPLSPDPSGIDPEAFVRLSDGTFWIAEEFGPSLLQVAADGTILKRLVPNGSADAFKDADYEVVPSLPAIMRWRASNRGFEGLAISPDERFLYVMMQSPLALPDQEAFRKSRHVRIWKIVRETGAVINEYLYLLDKPTQFQADSDGRERLPFHVHVSEIVALDAERLLVLERIDKTARLFTIRLSDDSAIPPLFDNPDKSPSLEALETERLIARGMLPLEKTLILDTDQVPGLPGKIEGIAVVAPNELILVNDNDFGIDGVRTQMFRVTLPQPLIP